VAATKIARLIASASHYKPSRPPAGSVEPNREAVVREVHVPVTVEQDEDGVWCAHAWLGSSGGANASGDTREEALASLRDAVQMVLDEDGVPPELAETLDLEVA
jgi:predicted RNase H-like HicB family nuclease